MEAFNKALVIVGGPTEMARIIGVTTQAVCFWRDGKRILPVEHGAAIEAATKGVVSRKELYPNDWRRVWPELEDAA